MLYNMGGVPLTEEMKADFEAFGTRFCAELEALRIKHNIPAIEVTNSSRGCIAFMAFEPLSPYSQKRQTQKAEWV